MTDREEFIQQHGLAHAHYLGEAGDASTRRYERFAGEGGRHVLLMHWPSGAPIANMDAYSYEAHLAREMGAFLAVGHWLEAAGLSVPRIFAARPQSGLMLLEDFGTEDFGALVAESDDDETDAMYEAAIDALLVIAAKPVPEKLIYETEAGAAHYSVPDFSRAVFLREAGLFSEKFLQLGAAQREEFSQLWSGFYDLLAPEKPSLIIRDYHSPNLFFLPEREGAARAGIIDFQDALIGTQIYDLASLLQDARLSVPPARAEKFITYYAARRRADGDFMSDEDLLRDFTLLSTQRLLKVFGIFEALRVNSGKTNYMRHLPRLEIYLARNLRHAVLTPFRLWLAETAPVFSNKLAALAEKEA